MIVEQDRKIHVQHNLCIHNASDDCDELTRLFRLHVLTVDFCFTFSTFSVSRALAYISVALHCFPCVTRATMAKPDDFDTRSVISMQELEPSPVSDEGPDLENADLFPDPAKHTPSPQGVGSGFFGQKLGLRGHSWDSWCMDMKWILHDYSGLLWLTMNVQYLHSRSIRRIHRHCSSRCISPTLLSFRWRLALLQTVRIICSSRDLSTSRHHSNILSLPFLSSPTSLRELCSGTFVRLVGHGYMALKPGPRDIR